MLLATYVAIWKIRILAWLSGIEVLLFSTRFRSFIPGVSSMPTYTLPELTYHEFPLLRNTSEFFLICLVMKN